MFSNRRPIPSARTVRLLYQLGYICSGTAAGLATLCLEEQRRRIQVLQRISDNAKIIRQSPRYRGNHVLAVATPSAAVEDADGEFVHDSMDGEWSSGRWRWIGEKNGDESAVRTRRAGFFGEGRGKRRESLRNHAQVSSREASGGVESELDTPRKEQRDIGSFNRSPASTLLLERERAGSNQLFESARERGGISHEALQSQQKPTTAVSILQMFGQEEEGSVHPSDTAGSADSESSHEAFTTAMENGDLEQCIPFLRQQLFQLESDVSSPDLEAFIGTCEKSKKSRLLVTLFDTSKKSSTSMRKVARSISPDSLHALCIAFAARGSRQQDLEVLYFYLPAPQRLAFDEAWPIPALRASLNNTRSLKHNGAWATKLTHRFQERGDKVALAQLDEVLLEGYIKLGYLDRALKLITRMHKTSGASNVAILQFALLLAKQGSWNSLQRLLRILQKMQSFQFSKRNTATFNAVIYEYSRKHNATQLWDFVVAAQQDLGFRPSSSTTHILLNAFVGQDRFDLIPKWYEFLSSGGIESEIDAKMAVHLLRTFHGKHRPSHVLIMRLCRRLALHCPSLATKELLDLVRHSLGYDLRHVSGQHARSELSSMKKRLKLLDGMDEFPITSDFDWKDGFDDHGLDFEVEYAKEGMRTAPDATQETPKQLESKMWMELSRGRHQAVLDIYHDSLDAVGLPATSPMLEIAVHASLRLHPGDRAPAEKLLAEAQEAGANTSGAASPLLIHSIKQLNSFNVVPGLLRRSVISHYRANEENGSRVSHHLAVTAAHALIIHKYVEEGLRLLSFIYTSHLDQRRPLDDVAFTVFLKGYIARQNLDGIRWVVQTVLDQNIRITRKFITQLKFIQKGDFKWMNTHPSTVHPLLTSWVQLCNERRLEQLANNRRLGLDLVKNIIQSTSAASNVNRVALSDDEADLQDESDSDKAAFIDESYFSDEVPDGSDNSEQSVAAKARMDKERDFRARMKSAGLAGQERPTMPNEEQFLERMKQAVQKPTVARKVLSGPSF